MPPQPPLLAPQGRVHKKREKKKTKKSENSQLRAKENKKIRKQPVARQVEKKEWKKE